MKWQLLGILFLSSLAFAAEKDDLNLFDELPDDIELDEDEALLREIEEKHVNADLQRENDFASQVAADVAADILNPQGAPVEIDPCTKIPCGAGKICQANGKKAACVCIPDCPLQEDPRRKVCTNKNETWNSDCEVYRQRCLCDTNDKKCKSEELKHIHINYYGECRQMPTCNEEEMSDFPRRMRDWLFNVMRDLAEREELPSHYLNMEQEAESNLTRRWANAAVWKWCDLDGHPHDRSVSRHELFPIRAPLMSLEHCIEPFLESCDPNDDHRITLQEWGKCLQLDEDDLQERCDDIAEANAPNHKTG